MLQLLTILLYLNLVTPSTTYQTSQIDGLVSANQTQVLQVENNPTLEDQVYTAYEQSANTIIIIDQGEGH